jgi:hypothetical protein
LSELVWLIDLLLNHKISRTVRAHVANRIGEIQTGPSMTLPKPQVVNGSLQAPSTIALMEKHEPVINATPQTAKAMLDRQEAINKSINSNAFTLKPEPGRTSPRKF